jgi:hypothetical protein
MSHYEKTTDRDYLKHFTQKNIDNAISNSKRLILNALHNSTDYNCQLDQYHSDMGQIRDCIKYIIDIEQMFKTMIKEDK